MKVFIDTETVPGQNPQLRKEIAAQIPEVPLYEEPTCPRNIKKPETKHEWEKNTLPNLRAAALQKYKNEITQREAIVEETWRKTALSGDQGEIICIAWAIEDKEPHVVYRNLGSSETRLLESFFDLLSNQLNKRHPSWVGHNVLFDLRFIFHRAVILGIKPRLSLHLDAKPWSEQVQDTMMMWAGIRDKIALDRLCKALHIQTKDMDLSDGEKIDGSLVWDFVKRGEIEKVATYCKYDVIRCREVYKRINFIEQIAPTFDHTPV